MCWGNAYGNPRIHEDPDSSLGKEIDLQQWDTLIFKGEHAENEHWRLVEDRNGQVGYAPAAFLMVILDTTAEEEESSATKKGLENSTDEKQKIEQGGGRSSVFTGSKDRACDRESREDHGKRKGRDHTGTHRDE